MFMLKMRTLGFACGISALLVCSFMAGRAGAQQPLPTEHPAPYSFPRAWGELHGVAASPTGRGLAYVFIAADGTIRTIYANPAGLEQIEAVARR